VQQASWIKQNIFLVAAVVLPIAVAGLFLLATALPRAFVDAPRYGFLVSLDEHRSSQSDYSVQLEVVGNKLRAEALYNPTHRFYQDTRLYRFNPGTHSLTFIPLEVPDDVRDALAELSETNDGQLHRLSMRLPSEAAELSMLSDPTAPDGYRFRSDYRGNSGLFGALFGMGRRGAMVAIEKDARVVEITPELEQADRYAYHNVRFLGWIIDE